LTALVEDFTATPVMGSYAARVLALLRRRAWHIVALAILLAAVDFLRGFHVAAAMPGEPFLLVAAEVLSHWLVRCSCLIGVISACEATMMHGARRVTLQALALLGSAMATSYGLEVFLFGNAQILKMGFDDSGAAFAYALWLQLCAAGLVSWYYQARGDSTRLVASLRAAELTRQHAHKRLLESRLEIVKAQVEPEFLLDTLARVQDLYELDAARAGRALDHLIDYLRAALPQLRDRSTTLGRELALVDAYLRIVGESASPVRATIEPLTEARQIEYAPPMVLLPLVQIAVDACDRCGGGGIVIAVEASLEALCVQLHFDATPRLARDARLAPVHRTLHSLFGPRAALVVAASGASAVITVSWPRNPPTRSP
jgi:hypothetical protein